ncbi:MAG: hypothetical protein ABI611_06335 [Solirubrobacteraceae bacterium]
MSTQRLDPLPPTFAATVAALHRVAERIVAPARKPANEIALVATPGGFGTPVFDHAGARHQVRVDGADLVHHAGDEERRTPLTTLAAAGRLVDDLLAPGGGLDDESLGVDAAAAAALAGWYALGAAVLGALASGARAGDAPTPAWLWPEHFDIAIELGPEPTGGRANYGFSPGDEQHAEPYAYVGPWTAGVGGELWQATGFRGAELTYAELLMAPDPAAAALAFFTARHDALSETARSEA